LPEITLAITIITITALSGFLKSKSVIFYMLLSGLLLSIASNSVGVYSQSRIMFNGVLIHDNFSVVLKFLIIFSVIVMSLFFFRKSKHHEEYLLLLIFTLGNCLSVSSSDLIMLFISLEMSNIAIYILFSSEKKPALKYFIYGITSSLVILYGISILYGLTGSTGIYEISKFLSFNTYNSLTLLISILLITAGLGFKLLVFPFNFIFPEMSEKFPIANISLPAIPSLITGIAVITRLLFTIFHDVNSFETANNSFVVIDEIKWELLIAIISAASIVTGNLVVLWQYHLRKIFAFIILSQSGYLLMAIAAGTIEGLTALMLNLIIFTFNMLGVLFCLKPIMEKYKISVLNDLKGLGRNEPVLCIALSVFLLASIGFPLTWGFPGKIYVYSSVISQGYQWLVFISIISSAAYLYFIFRLIHTMFSSSKHKKTIKIETLYKIILLIFLIPVILLGIYFSPFYDLANYSSKIFGI